MDSTLLTDILVLIEEGSLSKAAKRRNVTQPAFSRRIRAFEDWVGIPLIERGPNQIELGRCLIENEDEIRSFLHRFDVLRQTIQRHDRGHRTLSITTQHALCTSIFSDLHKFATARCGPLSWSIRTMNRPECIPLFLKKDADILLTYEARDLPPLPITESINRAIWRRDTLIPAIGGSLRYTVTEDGRLPPDMPQIVFPEHSHFSQLIKAYASENMTEFDEGAPRIESAFTMGVLEMIRNGFGLGWIPHSLARPLVASGDLINLAPSFGRIPLDISVLAWRSNTLASSIIDMLRQE